MKEGILKERRYIITKVLKEYKGIPTTAGKKFAVGDSISLTTIREYAKEMGMIYQRLQTTKRRKILQVLDFRHNIHIEAREV